MKSHAMTRFILLLALCLPVSPGFAQTFTVDTTGDSVDASPGDGTCADGAGACSLRAAVQEANALAGADIIDLPAGTYTLSIAGAGEDSAATGDIDISEAVTIRGAGAATTLVDGNGAVTGDRIFHFLSTADASGVSGLTLSNGNASAHGGAIYTTNDLAVDDVIFQNNQAGSNGGALASWTTTATMTVSNATFTGNTANSYGGAILAGGILELSTSAFSNNSAQGLGGAIYGHNGSTLNISGCTIDGSTTAWGAVSTNDGATINISDSTISNTTPAAGSYARGVMGRDSLITLTRTTVKGNTGGVACISNTAGCTGLNIIDSAIEQNTAVFVGTYSFDGLGVYSEGPTTISGSSISNNTATQSLNSAARGAGIYCTGDLTISNSTISGNAIPGNGTAGALYFTGTTGTITNATITSNHADMDQGGIYVNNASSTLTISNSIISGNWSSQNPSKNCYVGSGQIISGGHNIENLATCPFTAAGDQLNTDPLITALADNGGPTQTRALQAGSPAIDAGDTAICAAAPVSGVDQRGFSRDATCDIGAYEEVPLSTLNITVAGTGSGTVTSSPGKIDCQGATGTCSDTIGANDTVTLTATPATGSAFLGWSGDADCSDGQVAMTTNVSCTATFDPATFTLTTDLTPTGGGSITGTGISCPGDCTEAVAPGTQIVLTATPLVNYSFSNWSGCDSANGNQCTMTLSADKSVTAVFSGVPDIAVTDAVAPVDDLQVPFGDVMELTSSSQTLSVANVGNADLTIGSLAAANPIETGFAIFNDLCSNQVVAPAGSCTFDVDFSPAAPGAFSGDFDIPSDDPDEASVIISLSGTGTATPAPNIGVSDSLGLTDDLQMPFPDTTAGVNSATETVTLGNSGNADLNVSSFQLGGTDAGDFVLDMNAGTSPCGSAPLTVPAGGSCTAGIGFAPATSGDKTAAITIASNDANQPSVQVQLTGTCLAATTNNPPSQPILLSPANGQGNLPTTLTFRWRPSSDPDGDPVSYEISVCTDADPFANCTPVQVTAANDAFGHANVAGIAGPLGGLLLFGVILAAPIGRKRKLVLLATLLLVVGSMLSSCSDSDPIPQESFTITGLTPGSTYYWGVTAKDNQGGATDSVVWSFHTR